MRALPPAFGTLTKRALAGAVVRLPPAWVAAAARATRPTARCLDPDSFFERDEGTLLPLLDGYRDRAKGRWRSYWWSTRALLVLRSRGVLPPRAGDLVDALLASATLPAPAEEFAAEVSAIAAASPGLVRPTGRDDTRLHSPILAVVPSADDVRERASVHAADARAIAAELERHGVELARASVLEAGCGRGYTAAALAALGGGEVIGIDVDLQGESLPEEMLAVRRALDREGRVQLRTGDLRALAYPDSTFDAVYSAAVLEHVDDLARALAELRRVTKPGGIGFHGVDHWFGPAGGHSLCTLDFPWGHARLHDQEVERYLRELRPNEADDAIDLYRHGFQRPRQTLNEMAAAARGAGFEVLTASRMRLPLRDPHRAWFSSPVLRECRHVHPTLNPDDLLAISVTLVLRRG